MRMTLLWLFQRLTGESCILCPRICSDEGLGMLKSVLCFCMFHWFPSRTASIRVGCFFGGGVWDAVILLVGYDSPN